MNIKENLAKNIALYRKAKNLTQAELAEKINYSDKAVSKWERGESVPEITVLKQLADFFGITVDALINEPKKQRAHLIRNLGKRRIYTGLWSLSIVWLVAILLFAYIDIVTDKFNNEWLFFVYAIPVSLLVINILTAVWGKNIANLVIVSLFCWTLIASIYITLLLSLANPPIKLWEIFLIGIPLEGLLVFLFLYKRAR